VCSSYDLISNSFTLNPISFAELSTCYREANIRCSTTSSVGRFVILELSTESGNDAAKALQSFGRAQANMELDVR
jgi:hypothetical protein